MIPHSPPLTFKWGAVMFKDASVDDGVHTKGEYCMTEEHTNDIAIVAAQKDKIVKEWLKSGLLEGITDVEDRRNMAVMLNNTANWYHGELQKYMNKEVAPILKETYIEELNNILLPLVRKVFGPDISRYGSMMLPAAFDDNFNPILCKVVKVDTELPHISTIPNGFHRHGLEADYVEQLSVLIREFFNKEIKRQEELYNTKVKLYIYMPIMLSTIYNVENLSPSHFTGVTRFAVTEIR
jgi:hypothetical protein